MRYYVINIVVLIILNNYTCVNILNLLNIVVSESTAAFIK